MIVLIPSEKSQAATIVSESFPVGPEFLRSDNPGCAPSFMVSISSRVSALLEMRGLSILPL